MTLHLQSLLMSLSACLLLPFAFAGESQQSAGSLAEDAATPLSSSSVMDKPDRSALPYKYVGNLFSSKFHRPSCPFAKCMSAHNAVLFHFRKEAVDAGQKPCRYCLPKTWKTVKAALYKSKEDTGQRDGNGDSAHSPSGSGDCASGTGAGE